MKKGSNIPLDKYDESCASNSGTFKVASQVQLHPARLPVGKPILCLLEPLNILGW